MKFNAKKQTEKCIKWIRNYFINTKGEYAIIGISGGKDSSIAAALCVEALGKDKVIGVMIPDEQQPDELALGICEELGIKTLTVSINEAKKTILSCFGDVEVSDDTKINLPPRLRMATLFAVSQSFPNGRVVCTSNLSEKTVGYSTLFGDSAGHFAPLAKFTVDEVKQIGIYLNLSSKYIDVVPSDGLSGVSDEEKLGIRYSDLDKYLRTGKANHYNKKEFARKYILNKFKLDMIKLPTFNPCLYQKKIKYKSIPSFFRAVSVQHLILQFKTKINYDKIKFKKVYKGINVITYDYVSNKKAKLYRKPKLAISTGCSFSSDLNVNRNIKIIDNVSYFYYSEKENILYLCFINESKFKKFWGEEYYD